MIELVVWPSTTKRSITSSRWLHVAHVDLHDVAVLARHAVALHHLGRLPRHLGHVLQLPGRGRMRMIALSEKPRARGSMSAW